MNNLKQKALSGVFWTGLQQFSTQGISFVVSIILARLLLPAEFGLIAMLGVFTAVAWALMNSGLGSSLIRTDNPTQEDYSTVFFFNLTVSVILYLILVFTAPYIAGFYKQPMLISIVRWNSLNFIINAFGMVQLTRLTKLMDFKTQLKISIPSIIISGAVGVSMAYMGYGVWSLVWMGIVQNFTSTIQLWWYSKWSPTFLFNKDLFFHHFNFGYKLTLSGILDGIFSHIYTIVIGKFFAPALVGYFNRAQKLRQLPVSNIAAVLNKVTFPLFAELKNDNIRLKNAFKKIMQVVVFIVAPILLVMAALAEPLFRFLFTEKWLPAVPYFQILCWSGILYPIHTYNLNILTVKGRSDLFLKLEIVKKVMITVVIVISFQFGIYGLLYGSVLTSVLAFFINTHYSGKFINYSAWEQTKDILPIILLAAFSGGCVYGFDMYLQQMSTFDIFRLLFGGLLGVIIYLFLAFLFKMTAITELKKLIFNR
ncbi:MULTISPECIES: lipopolysaccharide biosynthesis protein [Flavobacteriaceae]|uniref:Lipopolysaccharide biosynthesis protein n=2 Tax=Flavobacteriaceae TaxID=49546 RepID=A0A4Y8ATR3_9FLAO|nr:MULTISPECIES: lipopolysaccharide biosynthesis protein [Flavobacteriaceae]TEW75228.1 lipopolysaccharide biosynthesis protein [Gramella jeungdoensis]GGK60368.1 lipopolysaccharide biosynthesis protein [Lutibacter litoralis]